MTPRLDVKNPCYSSTETASAFLTNVASEFDGPPRSRDQYLLSFLARLLYPPQDSGQGFFGWPLKHPESSFADDLLSHSQTSATTSVSESSDAYNRAHSTQASPSFTVPAKRRASLLNNNGNTGALGSSLGVGIGLGKRKYASISSDQSTTYTDLQASPKRRQSPQSINQSSFIVLKADPIADFGSPVLASDDDETDSPAVIDLKSADGSSMSPTAACRSYDAKGYGAPVATCPTALTLHDCVKLAEKLRTFGHPTFQDFIDIICTDGNLNARILRTFRRSDIRRIDMTKSLTNQSGHNDTGRLAGMLQVLGSPGSFRALTFLLLDNVPLENRDILHIHHLPMLAGLNLCNTGIGDEAVFHLVALRPTLTTLLLHDNPAITDDATPALSLLNNLALLYLRGTSITMIGLRRLASSLADSIFEVDIPVECQYYLDNLHTHYLPSPAPPLVTSPSRCASLTIAALKRNLQAHAAYNADIVIAGGKAQLCARLEQLLTTRAGDLAVREMVRRSRQGDKDDRDDDVKDEL
ncbi:hypothetical protein BV25DRAFT_210514 [Artomyces pyxidatus]|uniref:Uncharacterized protein n=1 Tax=Artomyces pyxidatus TaxID=48021 RepID=A0ACB8T825_9AGAM|nr:hypothetical protein BV25DRAFT_210514 [Artomyces pyxidatus]